MTPGCPGRLGRQGTVALSDHPVWLPPLRHSNPADHSQDRVVPSWRLQMEAASTSGFAGAFRLNANRSRRSDLAPLSAESWVMPGSPAETRADACRPSGAVASRSGAAALLVRGRFDRGGGSGGSGRGELLARLARLLLRRLHGLAAALGDGQPAGEQAKTDQRSPPRPARFVAALLGSLPGHHVHLRPPAPADWVALLFPVREE